MRKVMAALTAVMMVALLAIPCRAAEKKVSKAERTEEQIVLTVSESDCVLLLAGYSDDGQLLVCSQGLQREQTWTFQVNEAEVSAWYVYFLDPDTCAPLYPAENITKLFKQPYGDVPIYFGDVYIDYMASEILKEIDLDDKSDVERIRAVYDWIIVNCERYGTADTLYFDTDEVEAEAEDFAEYMLKASEEGKITLRIDVAGSMGSYDPESGYYILDCDANEYIAYAAAQMMLYRVGQDHNFAGLLTVLLGHLGYDCRMIEGEWIDNDGSKVSHIWNMVLLDGAYLWLDVRMDHTNYVRTGKLSYTYFLVVDTVQWEKKHSWDHAYSDALMDNIDLLLNAYGLTLQE